DGAAEDKAETWLSQVLIHKDADGWRLLVHPYVRDEEGKWQNNTHAVQSLVYWPTDREKKPLEIEGIEGPRRFSDEVRQFVLQVGAGKFRVSLDSQLIADLDIPAGAKGQSELHLAQGD